MGMNRKFNFRNLIYALVKTFPVEEKYALGDQMRRAVVSVTSNIAEGSGRQSLKDQAHFLELSYGSLMEVMSQLDLALDLNFIDNENYNRLELLIEEEAKIVSGYRASLLDRASKLNTL